MHQLYFHLYAQIIFLVDAAVTQATVAIENQTTQLT
jgi:hypothetical protein